MRRLNAVFALVVGLSMLVGATAAADFGSELNTLGNVIPAVQEQVTTEVQEVRVVDETLHVTVRFENPTGYAISITGASFRVFNDTDVQLAQGPATDGSGRSVTVPARGEVTARYEVPLTATAAERVRAALERGGTRMSGRFGAVLNDETFTLRMDPRPVDERGSA